MDITNTILDIIHRPVFYLKLSSTLQVCLYVTRSILRLRYEPDRLMLSIGLPRWYININIKLRDIIQGPVFNLKHDVSETAFCLRFQVEPIQLDQIDLIRTQGLAVSIGPN
jgi:hypothetical protein